jgi:hypothetical protein
VTAAVVQMRKLVAGGGAEKPVTRPVLRWHGGKWRLAPWILEHFPQAHTCYVEPYGGGANVLLRKPRQAAECYNDLDGTVVNVFRVLRDPQSAAELARRLRLTPYSRAEFEWSYETASDAIDAAHKVIVRSFMGFGSDSVTRNCKTGFRARMTNDRSFPSAAWRAYLARSSGFAPLCLMLGKGGTASSRDRVGGEASALARGVADKPMVDHLAAHAATDPAKPLRAPLVRGLRVAPLDHCPADSGRRLPVALGEAFEDAPLCVGDHRERLLLLMCRKTGLRILRS